MTREWHRQGVKEGYKRHNSKAVREGERGTEQEAEDVKYST
jgi:hypothetical protein